MTEKLQNKLHESKGARWIVLVFVSLTMMAGYFITDVMAPLKGMLEMQFHWESSDFGFFNSAYGWLNVFLLMLIFGGIILDKLGERITGVLAVTVMLVGVFIKYWAVSHPALAESYVTIFGAKILLQVLYASIGFTIFGVGVEVAGITVTKIIAKWFYGKELALAMGLQVACARLGTFGALYLSGSVAQKYSISTPVLLGVAVILVGLLSFLVFVVMDKKHDKIAQMHGTPDEDPFRFKDIFSIANIKAFWYIAILCVLFYSAVFPFLKYAPDLMVNKFGVSEKLAGRVPSLLPIGTLVLTPLFGSLYDKKGRGASIMLLGSAMLVLVHTFFAVPMFNEVWMAVILVLVLGVAFSLVPSAMWPSVAKIIPHNRLGTAYSLIFWIQNWGLMGVPYLIGKVLDKYCITGHIITEEGLSKAQYDYTLPMVIFASLGILAILFAFLLKREDAKKHYGLELPNKRS